MRYEILYTTALDNNGHIVHVNDAQKDNKYRCPECKKDLILRKSGKTGKGSKRPHFAHNELTPNCTPESVLHLSFKQRTRKLLETYLSENRKLELTWNCSTCSKANCGNILAKVRSIKEEYYLGECRPDIALLDENDQAIAVIEIVVTHKPNDKVIQFYRHNHIVMIQIYLTSHDDLNILEQKIAFPTQVDLCYEFGCSQYASHNIKRRVVVLKNYCRRCTGPLEKYAIEMNSPIELKYSDTFTKEEIELVRSSRENIKLKLSPNKRQYIPVQECIKCKSISARYSRRRRL